MSDLDIKAIRELVEKATPGKWIAITGQRYLSWKVVVDGTQGSVVECKIADVPDSLQGEDAAFIAAARTLVPQLLDALAQVTRERDEARAERGALDRSCAWIDSALAQAIHARDEARREADRWRHGKQIEGDYVCSSECGDPAHGTVRAELEKL